MEGKERKFRTNLDFVKKQTDQTGRPFGKMELSFSTDLECVFWTIYPALRDKNGYVTVKVPNLGEVYKYNYAKNLAPKRKVSRDSLIKLQMYIDYFLYGSGGEELFNQIIGYKATEEDKKLHRMTLMFAEGNNIKLSFQHKGQLYVQFNFKFNGSWQKLHHNLFTHEVKEISNVLNLFIDIVNKKKYID